MGMEITKLQKEIWKCTTSIGLYQTSLVSNEKYS
jgi:hypothetical protein